MGPTGMTKSGLASYGSSGREWSITVTWSPMQNQGGYHLLCFSAEINNKLSSKMICIDVLAGTPPPIILQPNCLTPLGDIVSGPNITFKMCFDKKFIRPVTNKYLIIYHSNGTEVKRLYFNDLDVATFSTVDDLMVIVMWGNTSGSDLLEYGQYFILIDVGSVAAPPLSCVSDWPGINQPWYWNFTVVDRTPPSLNFISIPTQVHDNEAISMSWNVSESLSFERCNLTKPSTSSIVNCHGSFNLGGVIAGNYSISIEIEDLHGNKAGPYEHHWVVTDVTQPSLTFVRNNSLARSNVSITWTVSEPVVSSNCTVTFPNGTLVYETCNDKWEAIDLPRGSYQISIVLVDSVGFIGEFQHKWTNIDVTPPILIFKRKPNRSQSKVNITWDTNEETNGLCQVEGPSSFYRSVVCDKAWSDDYLSEGEFILNVTVYDLSLNMAGPFQHKWYNSDVKPPELKVTISPLCDKSYDNATLIWTFNEFATSTCRIKTSLKSESVPCDKSWSGTFLPEGNVTIEVDARDSSGNSAPTFKYTWYNEDTTPPVLTFTKKEARTINDAVITWSINEPASTDCTLTTPFTTSVFSCESGSWSESSLQGGSYELSIYLLDLGNNSAGPYVHKWQNVDTIRPSFSFSKLPTRTYSNATIEWDVSEIVNGSCEIVGPSNFLRNVSCDGGWVGVNLPPGTFTFQLLVTDTSGNIGGPLRHTWINEDVTPPSLYWKGAPPSLTHGSIVLSWTTDEAVTSLCTVHSPIKETEVPCNNEWVGTELRHGEYSLTVIMVDGSGNKAQAVHHWNNTVLELVFELIMTLSNVRATNFFNKTSPEYSKFEAESQLALEKFYHSNIDNFKEIHIRKINVLLKSSSPEISTVSPGSDVEFDYDVVLVGNDLSTSSASLSKSLSKLSSGESSITIGGSTATFANVILLSNKRTTNVTFSRQTKPCEIAQFYVTCSLKEYCNEYTAMCVTNKRPDNNGLILSIGLGVTGLVVLVLVTATIGLFRSREKEEQHKRQEATKKRFETPLAAVTSLSQMMYNPYKY
ncbi:uncharacterized protein [Magallana gigas]|uniref:uncharacterized protein n=1 Tax=Magallana gigas TaxID=29159 RepID=UPI00333F9923